MPSRPFTVALTDQPVEHNPALLDHLAHIRCVRQPIPVGAERRGTLAHFQMCFEPLLNLDLISEPSYEMILLLHFIS